MAQLLNPQNLKLLYDTVSHRRKERFEIILEPLQSVLQLAFLSFCPDGSKITIYKNQLKIQLPNYTQPLVRWYQNDNKEDLFYLFYVCKRFSHFYSFTKQFKNDETNLYDLLIQLAKDGLDTLIRTYGESEKISLLHTLELYKVLLENPNQLNPTTTYDEKETIHSKQREKTEKETVHHTLHNTTQREMKDKQKINTHKKNGSTKHSELIHSDKKDTLDKERKNKQEIENIFVNITNLYKEEHLQMIFHTLVLICQEKETKIREKYMTGLNTLLEPVTSKINKWIHNNIVF